MGEFVTYKDSGVDIALLNELRQYGQETSRSSKTRYVQEAGGRFFLDNHAIALDFPHGRIIQETDGIGNKEDAMLYQNKCYGAGYDLVAANVNDVVRHGAIPLGATVDLKIQGVSKAEFASFMEGVRAGLSESECALLGGETAMHTNLAPPGQRRWHLSGTATGIASQKDVVSPEHIGTRDVILGLASSGIHTNGMNLAERVLGIDVNGVDQRALIDTLLEPSRIYVRSIKKLLGSGITPHGLIHVTGGGLLGRLASYIPNGRSAVLNRGSWDEPRIYQYMRQTGKVSETELLSAFNMGIGFAVIVSPQEKGAAKEVLGAHDKVFEIGQVEPDLGTRVFLAS